MLQVIQQAEPLQQLLVIFHQRAVIYKRQTELYQVKVGSYPIVAWTGYNILTIPDTRFISMGLCTTAAGLIEICADTHHTLIVQL